MSVCLLLSLLSSLSGFWSPEKPSKEDKKADREDNGWEDAKNTVSFLNTELVLFPRAGKAHSQKVLMPSPPAEWEQWSNLLQAGVWVTESGAGFVPAQETGRGLLNRTAQGLGSSCASGSWGVDKQGRWNLTVGSQAGTRLDLSDSWPPSKRRWSLLSQWPWPASSPPNSCFSADCLVSTVFVHRF